MGREGLIDDCGYKGFDFVAPCELGKECVYEGQEQIYGQVHFKCLANCGVCEFKERDS